MPATVGSDSFEAGPEAGVRLIGLGGEWHDDEDHQFSESQGRGAWRLGVATRVSLPNCVLFMATSQVSLTELEQTMWPDAIAFGPKELVVKAFNLIRGVVGPESGSGTLHNRIVRQSLVHARRRRHDGAWLEKYIKALEGFARANEARQTHLFERFEERARRREPLGPLFILGAEDDTVEPPQVW